MGSRLSIHDRNLPLYKLPRNIFLNILLFSQIYFSNIKLTYKYNYEKKKKLINSHHKF